MGIEDESLEQDEPLIQANFDQKQVFELAEASLDFLAALALPTITEYPFPPLFLALWELVKGKLHLKRDFFKLALGLPRGFGKTSVVKLIILYAILYTDKQFPIVFGATAGHAENIISDVCSILDDPNIIAVYGNWREGLSTDRKEIKQFTFRGREIALAALGQGGSVRGLNVKHKRPDLMVFDDIQSREDAESQIVSMAIEKWMLGTAMKSATHKGCMYLFIANMYPTPWSILKRLQKNTAWVKFITGAILVAPAIPGQESTSLAGDTLMDLAELGEAEGTIVGNSKYSSLWEALKPLRQLIAEFIADLASGHPEIFHSEVLNDPEASVNSHIDVGMLPPYPWLEDEIGQGRFIVIDPANDNTNSDAVSIGLFELIQAIPVSKEIEEGRFSPGDTVQRALAMATRSGASLIVVEGTAYQASLAYWLKHYIELFGLYGIQVVPMFPGRRSKNARILDMFKALIAGELYLHPAVRAQVCAQIVRFNPLKNQNVDGILDLLCYSTRIPIEFPQFIAINTYLAGISMVAEQEVLGVEETCPF